MTSSAMVPGCRRPCTSKGSTLDEDALLTGGAAFQPPAFILSFACRDELAAAVESSGWRPIAARRAEGIDRRFLASGAMVAIVDGRGDPAEALAAARVLAGPVEVNGAALLLLLADRDMPTLEAAYGAGATHVLAAPIDEPALGMALRFAARFAERLAGPRDRVMPEPAGEQWSWRPGDPMLRASATIAQDGVASARRMLARLDAAGRTAALDAIRRVRATGRSTAFAHDAGGGRRIVHHLSIDERSGRITGRVEDLEGSESARPRHDTLTGLADATAARAWITTQLAPDAEPRGCAVMIVGIRRFDMLTAAFGREVADSLLQGAARRIERVAASDRAGRRLIARIAASEFLVGLAGPVDMKAARFVAAQIGDAIARPFACGEHVVTVGCRIGLAISSDRDRAASDLLRRASAALAEARTADSDAIRSLESSGESAAQHDARLQIDLRRALDRDEIEILFQPQVDVTTDRVIGVEALARWRHPDLGELGAVTLFSTAERSGYLPALSGHVQRKALAIAATWPDALSDLRLSINVTAADIAQDLFARTLLAAVDASGFPRARLTVEVTESGLIEDLRGAAGLLAELRAGGVRVAIDDFGTGYSSLAYLKSLPLDYLKIDRRLSQDITGSKRDRVVVNGVIEMARSLGLSVVAEGVETEEQLALLAAQGCNSYQGYLCAPPLGVAELVRVAARRRRR